MKEIQGCLTKRTKLGGKMTNEEIRKSKINYINTNRLNRKVISNKIAMSWYKCKMKNLMIQDDPKISNEHSHYTFHFDTKACLQKLAIQNLNLFFMDLEGNVIHKIVYDKALNLISQFKVDYCGTTAAELFISDHEAHEVIFEEHYLDFFTGYCSYSLPVKHQEEVIGAVIVFSKDILPSNIIELFHKKMNQMIQESPDMVVDNRVDSRESNLIFDNMLWLTQEEQNQLFQQVNYVMSTHRPIMIEGPKQSGKRIIAQYIASKYKKPFILIDALDVLPELMKRVFYDAMSHYDTIIIANFEFLTKDVIKLLTVNSNGKTNKNLKDESSDIRAYNYILTTSLTHDNLSEKSNTVRRLVEYIGDNVIKAVNTVNRIDNYQDALDYLSRFDYEFSKDYVYKLLELSKQRSISELNHMIKESLVLAPSDTVIGAQELPDLEEEEVISLAELERRHVLETYEKMEHNMTLTAQVLGIGRSTLYRKLESYQNGTS